MNLTKMVLVFILPALVLLLLLSAVLFPQPKPRYVDESFHISGHVYGKTGRPIEHASIEATCKAGGMQWEAIAYTNYQGVFELRMEKREGFCIIKASSGGFSDTDIVFLDTEPEDIIFALNIETDEVLNGTLQGYITDLALNPIRGAIVEESYNGYRTFTDENGFYRFLNMTPGMITLVIRSPRFEMAVIDSALGNGEDKEINHSMSTKGVNYGIISGVVTVNQKVLENASVITLARNELLNATTDASGYYEFLNIPSGISYTVVAINGSLLPLKRTVKVSSGMTSRTDFDFNERLQGAYLGGFIANASWGPIAGANHTLKTEISEDMVRTDPTGYYSWGDLVYSYWPVAFRLALSADGYRAVNYNIVLENQTAYIMNYTLPELIE